MLANDKFSNESTTPLKSSTFYFQQVLKFKSNKYLMNCKNVSPGKNQFDSRLEQTQKLEAANFPTVGLTDGPSDIEPQTETFT